VMVWIHGGGFVFGSGNSNLYGPGKILDHDVILVTINYRLGPFGFLSMGDEDTPGNYGMWDQVEALRWVKNNIRAFGGDPERVTIFGESAGGISVGLLVASQQAEGLFQRAISQSGAAFCNHYPMVPVEQTSIKFAEQVSCIADEPADVMACLRLKPAYDLVKAFQPETLKSDFKMWPVIDGHFLTQNPEISIVEGEFNKVPHIAGITRDEGEYFLTRFIPDTSVLDKITEETKLPLVSSLVKAVIPMAKGNPGLLEKVLELYFKDLQGMDKQAIIDTLVEILGDTFLGACTSRTATEIAKQNVSSYLYNFDHVGGPSLIAAVFNKPPKGVPHADELPYLFDARAFGFPKTTGKHKEVEDRFLNMWTTFAKTGAPTADGSWSPVNVEEAVGHYRFSSDSMDQRPLIHHQKFHDSLAAAAAARQGNAASLAMRPTRG